MFQTTINYITPNQILTNQTFFYFISSSFFKIDSTIDRPILVFLFLSFRISRTSDPRAVNKSLSLCSRTEPTDISLRGTPHVYDYIVDTRRIAKLNNMKVAQHRCARCDKTRSTHRPRDRPCRQTFLRLPRTKETGLACTRVVVDQIPEEGGIP